MMADKTQNSEKYGEINSEHLITIIMPIFNGASTLDDVLVLLEKQDNKDLIREMIFINDNSTDNSREIIEKYQQKSAYTTRLIDNKTNEGLAKNYNKGIGVCSSDYFILMHQDIVLLENNCFENIIIPFSDNNVIAVFPGVLHPFSVWQKYNFWQKCLFSETLQKAKVYIDFGSHPGKDRIPREAAILFCCVITGKRGSAAFYEDVAISSEYKFSDNEDNIPSIVNKIRECLHNYERELKNFDHYREKIKEEPQRFISDLKSIFEKTE